MNESTDNQQLQNELSDTEFKTETNTEKPSKRERKPATEEQLNNPLHGIKLAQILERLEAHYGWDYMGERINIRCFQNNPSMKSSLGFLRRTEWARDQVKDLYVEMMEKRSNSSKKLP